MSIERLLGLPPQVYQALLTLVTGWLLFRLTNKRADLISFISHVQSVTTAAPSGVVHTFTLYLTNQGKAPAKNVEIGHFFLPNHSVFPDVVRTNVSTPGGGTTISIPNIAPKSWVSITYLLVNQLPNTPVISHITYEYGAVRQNPGKSPEDLSKVVTRDLCYSLDRRNLCVVWVVTETARSGAPGSRQLIDSATDRKDIL